MRHGSRGRSRHVSSGSRRFAAPGWFGWRLLGLGLAVLIGAPRCSIAASAASGAASVGDEAKGNPHVWEPATRSAAVFKNGMGFFVREGEVALRDGWCVSGPLPPAAFGTFGVYALEEGETVDLLGSGKGELVEFNGVDAPDDTAVKRERLEASRGLKVALAYRHHGSVRQATGELLTVGQEFAVIDSGKNSLAAPVASVMSMRVVELPIRVHIDRPEERAEDRARIGMAYLRGGITWIPDYTVRLIDDETAELTLRGTVVNDAEDLIHADLHLVVGVPHFAHSQYKAPIVVGQMIRTLGSALADGKLSREIATRGGIVSNSRTSPQDGDGPFGGYGGYGGYGGGAGRGDNTARMHSLLDLDDSASASDYTVYTKKDMTLRKGEKAIVHLFTTRVRYSHVYRLEFPERVRHHLRFENNTESAWTTGACLTMSDGRPLSEDLLKYTPQGGKAEVPVTAAVNIVQAKRERESDRALKTYSVHRTYYDLVTLEGEITLTNFEKNPVSVSVKNPVPGRPLEADHDGQLSTDASKLKLTERAGEIRWDLELDAGEKVTLRYEYERYVPSN